ncbi:MAG TPA: hypothetical protein VK524_11285 [Polyangiaceae bacterium]|nr:hypothetical protein [Polyangiaceae bacterium]
MCWRKAQAGLVVVFAAGITLACGGSDAKSARDGVTHRDTRIVHESCNTDSGEKQDANTDGKPDVIVVKSGGREVCRAVDLNFDGNVDSWVYRDDSGQVRRRETDYDRDGRVDEIAVYRAGVVSEKHRSTTLTHKLDTWQFYNGGVLARAERDADGDEVVDQWWEFSKPGCPLIHSDLDDDGRPDPGATVDYCKETGYVPPERMPYRTPASPDFQRPGSLPTEVENREMGSGTSPAPGATPAPAPAPAPAAPADQKGTK